MKTLTDTRRLTRQQVYSVCALVIAFLANQLAFQGARVFSFWRYHFDFTLPLDLKIPFLPWTLSIYFGAFVFWAVSLYFCSLRPREESDRLFCADIISKIVSFLFFVILPTTNVRPPVNGTGLFDAGMRFLFWIDRADNLFPSIHCSMSWLCWLWVRGKREIPLFWRLASFVFAAAFGEVMLGPPCERAAGALAQLVARICLEEHLVDDATHHRAATAVAEQNLIFHLKLQLLRT